MMFATINTPSIKLMGIFPIICLLVISSTNGEYRVLSDFPPGCHGGPRPTQPTSGSHEVPAVFNGTCMFRTEDEVSNTAGICILSNVPEGRNACNYVRFIRVPRIGPPVKGVAAITGRNTVALEGTGYKLVWHLGENQHTVNYDKARSYPGNGMYLDFPLSSSGRVEMSNGATLIFPNTSFHGAAFTANFSSDSITVIGENKAAKDGYEAHMDFDLSISQVDGGWYYDVSLHYGIDGNGMDIHEDVVFAKGFLPNGVQ